MVKTTAQTQRQKAIAFFDGQNLFHAVKDAFGYAYPNYHPQNLAQAVCKQNGWGLIATHFYTGVPLPKDNPYWAKFWNLKLGAMRRLKNVEVYSRELKYRNKTITCPNGQKYTITVGDEKGIDIRIALDVVSMAYKGAYDVALIFSQDQDLSEVADEVRMIAKIQKRFIKVASAFPLNPTKKYLRRGINEQPRGKPRGIEWNPDIAAASSGVLDPIQKNKTDWLPFGRAFYDKYIDPKDYRPKK